MIALQAYSDCGTSTVIPLVDERVYSRNNSYRPSTTIKLFFAIPELSKEAFNFIQKINSFSTLKDNWDSYGANKPNQEAIRNSIKIIKRLDLYNIKPYFTAPGPNGEVLVELKYSSKFVEIYFNSDNTNEIYFYNQDECIEEGQINEMFDKLLEFIDVR
jgi:hypothetical protein